MVGAFAVPIISRIIHYTLSKDYRLDLAPDTPRSKLAAYHCYPFETLAAASAAPKATRTPGNTSKQTSTNIITNTIRKR